MSPIGDDVTFAKTQARLKAADMANYESGVESMDPVPEDLDSDGESVLIAPPCDRRRADVVASSSWAFV